MTRTSTHTGVIVYKRVMALQMSKNEVANQKSGIEEFFLEIKRGRTAPGQPGGLRNGSPPRLPTEAPQSRLTQVNRMQEVDPYLGSSVMPKPKPNWDWGSVTQYFHVVFTVN